MTSFREELIEFARKGVALESRCHNEECTKQYLVLPFVHLLGYDQRTPSKSPLNTLLTSPTNTKTESTIC